LEIFFNENPIFLSEIENIDTVRNALIRKELILVDEDSQAFISIESLLCMVLDLKKPVEEVENIIKFAIDWSNVDLTIEMIHSKIQAYFHNENYGCNSRSEQSIDLFINNEKDSNSSATIDPERLNIYQKHQLYESTHGLSSSFSNVSLGYGYATYCIFKEIIFGKLDFLVKFVLSEGSRFREFVVETGFSIIKNC